MTQLRLAAGLFLAAATVMAGSALAQQQPPAGKAPLPPAAGPQAPSAQKRAPSGPTSASQARPGGEAPPSGDAALRARVEQLEEQLVDLQVVIGTLESLAKSAGTAASSATYRAPAAGGNDGYDTQLRALLQQVEQLADRVRALEGRGGAGPAPVAQAAPPPTGRPAPQQRGGDLAPGGFGQTTIRPGGPGAPGAAVTDDDDSDGIGGLIRESRPGAQPGRPSVTAAAPPQTPGGPLPPVAGESPKQIYEIAYGQLLQQDYGAAESSFSEFLVRYPTDPLAGNAQYWLGETYFVRGQYKAAAGAFLKGYQQYGRSSKAPESLLKLAVALDRLGQREAACSSFGELGQKFPNAAPAIRARAISERQRLGCQ
jgi:tol-pal system protein YbgF